MDRGRLQSAADQAKGKIKSAAGKVLGDRKLQVEGETDKATGKVEGAAGDLRDVAHDAAKHK